MSALKTRQFLVEHISSFHYGEPAHGSLMVLRVRPREDQGQRILKFNLRIDPLAALTPFEDSFGNACHLFNIHREHQQTTVRSRVMVESADAPPPPTCLKPDAWDTIADVATQVRYWEFLRSSGFTRPVPAFDKFIMANGIRRGADPLSSLLEMAFTLYTTFAYEPGSTEADSSISSILETGRGVCQDYTHVMITIARSWGIPSRYVSGYLHLEGVTGEQALAGASHAWAEFLLPDMGWVGIDPTNNTFADHRHIRVAVGRDYADAAPTRGVVVGGGESKLSVRVTVVDGDEPARAGEPRATPPNLHNVAPTQRVSQTGFDHQ